MFKNNIITSALVSMFTVLIGMVFLPSFINFENERADAGTHRPTQYLISESKQGDENIVTLQFRIDELLEKQWALLELNQRMEERVAQLESAQFDRADELVYLAESQDTNNSTALIDQEEQALVLESETDLASFDSLADQVFSGEYDSVWASEMEASFDEVTQRLQSFNQGSTTITSSECRSPSCMVEFTHQEDIDQALIASLLPARGAKEVVLKHVREGDVEKTLAVYLR